MRVMVVMGLATAAVLGGVASASAAAHPEQARTAALLKTVTVKASEFKFALSSKSAKRGVVIFKVTNVGKIQHSFEIKGRKTQLISPGKSTTLRVTFLRKGHYPYKCYVTGHAALGMKGVFTVT